MEPVSVVAAFPVSLAVAFALGFGARFIGLPPMVGFLIAGFLLHAVGVQGDETIQKIADFGVTLLLFTIGLKLKIKGLARPEVWAGASVHALITVGVFGLGFYVLALAGFSVFADLDLETAFLIAFALSFSSTVFAVKVLEDKGEMSSMHGRTAIGILVMQDIFAVVFLTVSTGKVPSPWAIALVGLVLLRPVLFYLLDKVGHGELLPMFGLFAALALGVATFEMVGMKADLGALLLGMLLANHKRASEVADSLFSFKEIFLVGFFLNIGLSGAPTLEGLGIAVLLVILIPLKVALFFYLLTRFRLRARSSLLSSLSLTSYSEFGLIVGAIGVSKDWIGSEWLVIVAIALSISFVAASPLNRAAHGLYSRWRERLVPFETATRHPEDQPLDAGDAEVVIFGMGRMGTGAYDYIHERIGIPEIGIDSNAERVAAHQAAGRNVILGDATDSDFWERATGKNGNIQLIMLAMPEHHANMYALKQIASHGYEGYVAGLAQYPDHVTALEEAGAHIAFNSYAEAGAGFAAHVENKIREVTDTPESSQET